MKGHYFDEQGNRVVSEDVKSGKEIVYLGRDLWPRRVVDSALIDATTPHREIVELSQPPAGSSR